MHFTEHFNLFRKLPIVCHATGEVYAEHLLAAFPSLCVCEL